jgi:DNA-directed RNA polymerase specialized sigma24 family protein
MQLCAEEREQVAAWVQQECVWNGPRYRFRPEEIVGLVFEGVIRLVSNQAGIKNLEGYVRASCRYEIANANRKERRKLLADGDIFTAVSVEDPVREVVQRETNTLIQQTLTRLSWEEREALAVWLDIVDPENWTTR